MSSARACQPAASRAQRGGIVLKWKTKTERTLFSPVDPQGSFSFSLLGELQLEQDHRLVDPSLIPSIWRRSAFIEPRSTIARRWAVTSGPNTYGYFGWPSVMPRGLLLPSMSAFISV